jgi:hypothetical protein
MLIYKIPKLFLFECFIKHEYLSRHQYHRHNHTRIGIKQKN